MNESRKIIIRGFMLLIAAVYLIKLLYIQVFDDSYATAADNNAIVKEIQIPYRGQIYDRQNKLIVSNTPIFDLYITPRKAHVQDTARFCSIFAPLVPCRHLRQIAVDFSKMPAHWRFDP